jgi:hypothetical protein
MSPEQQMILTLDKLTEVAKFQAAASLAAGIIAAAGRPHSIDEAMSLANDIYFEKYPAPSNGRYDEWLKTRDKTVAKAHV